MDFHFLRVTRRTLLTVGSVSLLTLIPFVLLGVFCVLADPYLGAIARSHKDNMREMCKRTREVNAAGMGGEGYFYWFFNKHKLAPPSSVPAFWAEVRAHCPGAW
jgi:hypothetical protein